MDTVFLQVLVGAAVAGFVQGLSGFAFGLAAMGIWAWSVSPQLAGPMVVFGSLTGQLLSIHSVRRSLDLRRLLPFILGGVIGVPIGAAALPARLYSRISEIQFRRLVLGLLFLSGLGLLAASGNRLPRL